MKQQFKPYFNKEKFARLLSRCNKAELARSSEKFTGIKIGLPTIQQMSQQLADNPQLITLVVILFTINSIYKDNHTVNDFIEFEKIDLIS